MSNALAISGVTAVLEYLLTGVYSGSGLGSVAVSAKAPDLVQAGLASGSDSSLQVNLFLHQVTYSAAWRNVGQPSVGADGSTRLKNPPLALDLHYLLTAYASEDCAAGAVGLRDPDDARTPVLVRVSFHPDWLSLPSTNLLSTLLGASGLADQIEMIKITPATLGREELAWLWTALKADYRPTFPFQVSVVLIEPQFPTSAAFPVLSRNITVQAGPLAQLLTVVPPAGQAAPALGDMVTVTGQSLTGANLVVLTNQRLGISYPPFAPLTVTNSSVTFQVPNDPVKLPAGIYSLSMLFTNAGGTVLQSTNLIPIAIAPAILAAPPPKVVPNSLGLLVTVYCNPEVLPNQSVSLALGPTMVPVLTFDAQSEVLSFQFPTLVSGSYLARLRVDGVDSPVTVNWLVQPPVFTGPMVTV